MKALAFDTFGPPEVLRLREVQDPALEESRAIVRMKAIGLNFADIYRRRGDYHLAGAPPYIAGYEGAGIVEHVHPNPLFRVGDRVAFADSPFANAELVSVPFEKLIPLPNGISCETAAASMLQGLTAQYLTRDSHPVRPGETALVHAAAGGVGLLLVQMVRLLGGVAIGLTSSERKREASLSVGAAAVFLYSDDWKNAVRAHTGGRGVDVVFDSVGSTLLDSFDVTRVGGRVVFYGMAGGAPPLVSPRMLMDTSKTLTGGDLWNVLDSLIERRERAAALFDSVLDRSLKVTVARTFSLADGEAAHRYLESRDSIGKVLLVP